ncbi:hypothetical protein [Micromonospora sp. RTGN7]|uniref:hypothetical protein n=1 Tax=Micromonospora sp. RTGN7 TaxID=3016526 RepID=UPI0029FEE329|nr:hypothetical protein [Micromonospora sp. RTGN7]
MAIRDVSGRRRGGVLHVVGSVGGPRRMAVRPGRVSPTRQWRGPAGPPPRDDDRR